MPTNRELKRALLSRLDITPQALSQRVQKKREAVPMTTEEATYLIAHEEGIRIDKYLDPSTLDKIRQLTTQSNRALSPTKGRVSRGSGSKSSERVIRFPNEFKAKDPILPDSKLKEAKEMAAIYPLFYVLENSIREAIKGVMKRKHGDEWWQHQLTSGKEKHVKDKASSRMGKETRDKWHQRRGSHPIDYVDLEDLETIVRSNEVDFFPDILPDREWFGQFMRELIASRNVVCHMNPLDKTNIQDLKVKVAKWNKQIGASNLKLP